MVRANHAPPTPSATAIPTNGNGDVKIIEIENFQLEDEDLSSQSVLSDLDTPLYPGSDT